jgi:hypothetical protein
VTAERLKVSMIKRGIDWVMVRKIERVRSIGI